MKKGFLFLIVLSVSLWFTAEARYHDSDPTERAVVEDHGELPWVVDVEEITLENAMFRRSQWTGRYLQMTLMSIPPGGEIGGEIHPDNDQFIRLEQGTAQVLMGTSAAAITFDQVVTDDWAVFIPAGYWHNLVNIGEEEVKLYSIYSPPEHPKGTVHVTFEESEADHHHH